MDIATLQMRVNERWDRQLNNPCHSSADSAHALLHITKAAGKLATVLNDAEHEHRVPMGDEIAKYLADLVICAARLGRYTVDLSAACEERLAEKFPIQ